MIEAATPPGAASPFRRHIWPLVIRYRWLLVLAFLLNGIHGAAIALQNLVPKWLFSEVLEAPELSMAERWRKLGWLIAGYLFVSLIARMAAWHAGYRLFTWVRERVVFGLRGNFFRHINHLCLRFHLQHPSGELFSYLFGSPLNNVMQFFQHASMHLPGAVVSVAITLSMFWSWDWVIAVILTVTSFANVALMLRARRRIERINVEFQNTEQNVSGKVADILRGTKAVKMHAMEEQVARDFEREALHIGRKSYERDVLNHIEYMKQESFGYFCYGGMLAACMWRYLSGHIDLGTVAACLASCIGLTGPIQAVFQSFTLWGGAEASINRIAAVLDTPSTTPDPAVATVAAPRDHDLEFDRVQFAYVPGQPVLRDISLRIPEGQRIALVGPSGSGKSTLAQLLLRLYDPQHGAVRLGGIDLRDFSAGDLRKHFGVVPQDPFIFRSTIRDNVRVAKPDASDAAIRRACEQSNAWEFIARLPASLDSLVGEGGASLSGGQRQRLAIARALLGDAPCFIFDEATSALDTLSEELIQDTLDRNLGGRTVILIAHRLATVKNCDRILVLEAGRIVHDGSYATLATQPGLFQDLVRGQSLRE